MDTSMDANASRRSNGNKKDRTANWRDDEIRTLLEMVAQYKEQLFASLSNTLTAKKKIEMWQTITMQINARGGEERRCWTQTKKKWSNLKARAVAHASMLKKIPTGGGPKVKEEWWMDLVLDIVGKENCVVTGISSQGESAVLTDTVTDTAIFDNEDASKGGGMGDDEHTAIIGHMIDDVIKDSEVLVDVINTDMAEVNDMATVSISSTPKRHIRNKRKALDTTQMGPKPKGQDGTLTINMEVADPAVPSANSSQESGITTGTSSMLASAAPTAGSSSMPTSVPGKTVNRLSQLQQKKTQRISSNLKDCGREVKDRKTIRLIDRELEKINAEEDYFIEHRALIAEQRELTRLQTTNAQLLQLKLYYEIKKLEREQQISPDQGVETLIQFDVDTARLMHASESEN